jgi:hypothetical protein
VYKVTGTIILCLYSIEMPTAAKTGGQHGRFNIFKTVEFKDKIAGLV